jgi:hypothetical protein
MNITLSGLWKIAFKCIRWLSGAQTVIKNGSTMSSIKAELYRNEKWQVVIEIKQLTEID